MARIKKEKKENTLNDSLKLIVSKLTDINKNLIKFSKEPKSKFDWGVLAVIISFLTLTLVAVPSSPNLFYSSSYEVENKICPQVISQGNGLEFPLSLINTGESPAKTFITIEGINIKIHNSDENYYLYHNNSYIQSNSIIDKGSYKFEITALDESNKNLSFSVRYKYFTYLFYIIPISIMPNWNNLIECQYIIDEDSNLSGGEWILIGEKF